MFLCSHSIQTTESTSRMYKCACVLVCVCGPNSGHYNRPKHCLPKGTNKVVKVTLLICSKHRSILLFWYQLSAGNCAFVGYESPAVLYSATVWTENVNQRQLISFYWGFDWPLFMHYLL